MSDTQPTSGDSTTDPATIPGADDTTSSAPQPVAQPSPDLTPDDPSKTPDETETGEDFASRFDLDASDDATDLRAAAEDVLREDESGNIETQAQARAKLRELLFSDLSVEEAAGLYSGRYEGADESTRAELRQQLRDALDR